MVASLFGTAICFTLISGAVFTAVCFLCHKLIARLFFGGVSFFPAVFLSVLISCVFSLYSVYQEMLKGIQDAKGFIIFSYVHFFLLLGSNIITVVVLNLGATGVLLSTLIVNAFMVLLMFVDLHKKNLLYMHIDIQLLKRMLKYSLPLIPHTIAYTVQSYATKLIISFHLSLSVLGLYSLASQFGMVTDVVLNSVQAAYKPWFFSAMTDNKKESLSDIGNTAYFLMWIYGLLFILIGVFAQEVILIMADVQFAKAWKYVPAIVFTIAVKSPMYFYMNILYFNKNKTRYIFISTVVSCIVNISLTYILIPYLNVFGSITADIVAMCIRLAIVIKLAGHSAKSLYSIFRLEGLALIPMAFMLVALIPSYTLYPFTLSITNIAYKGTVVILYILVLFLVHRKQLLTIFHSPERTG